MAEPQRHTIGTPEPRRSHISAVPTRELATPRGVSQAYKILRFGFTAAPLIAGLDKFFHLLADWHQYLAPIVPRVTGLDAHTFMRGVGVVEIIAGIGVAFKPRIFGYVVAAWLAGIIVNLLIQQNYYDIALRDFGLALGALALARLAAFVK